MRVSPAEMAAALLPRINLSSRSANLLSAHFHRPAFLNSIRVLHIIYLPKYRMKIISLRSKYKLCRDSFEITSN